MDIGVKMLVRKLKELGVVVLVCAMIIATQSAF